MRRINNVGTSPISKRGTRPIATGRAMIRLTRLNNQPLIVNSDLIKFIEQAPDTFVTLITGEKIVVREKSSEVVERIIEFRRSVLHGLTTAWDSSSPHTLAVKPSTPDPGPAR